MLRASLVIREKAYGHEYPSVARRGLFDVATILALLGKNAEGETAFRESLALREKVFAAGDPRIDAAIVALTMNGLGLHLAQSGHLREAETLIRRSLDMRRRAGDRGYAYALSLLDLGKVLAKQNRLAEAEAVDREGVTALANFVEPADPAEHRLEEATAQLAAVQKLRASP